ncbi:MAG: sulfotransferase [Thiobacillus sp.]|uniref:sulfotransferase family protein n=1 Tax=Thiobacillus sp. TaxID=924 RepID=UPI002734889C|nr:sulfotransferase [Thiobacillus sp.]MDP3585364.1 sulfotransferase [Thiobacillus sp.]
MIRSIQTALKGPAQALAQHRHLTKGYTGIASGLAALERVYKPPTDDTVAPIFLLSAGWRSGSTLLQRLVMSDKRVLIWGEPYDECGPIQAMAGTLKAFRPDWPPADYYYDGTPPEQLTGSWVANLFPAPDALWRAHRAYHDALFDAPAIQAGASRWGVKEVRLGIEHARYLRWLYPKARFVLLYRNPLDAYSSYCRYGRSWYDVFPDRPVFTPTAFGAHWRKLMEGYLAGAKSIGALLVRYEDLVGPNPPLAALDTYLGIQTDHGVLTKKVGSSERGGEKVQVNALERWLLRRAVGPVAAQLGYAW